MEISFAYDPVEEQVEQAVLPRLLLHAQVALIPFYMLDYPALLGVGNVRLTGQDSL